MKCEKCGAEISEDTKFCGSCGAEVLASEVDANSIKTDVETTTNTVVPTEKKDNAFKKFINDKRVLFGIGTILALVIIIVGVMTFLNKSPKQIFNKSIDQLFKTVENKMTPTKSKQISGKTNLKLETTGLGEISDIANKIALDFNYDVDYDKKIMNMNIKPTYGKDALIDVNAHFTNDGSYMYLNEVFNKYIKLPMDKDQLNEIFKNGDTENTKIMLNEIKKEFKNSLTSKYYTKEKTEIKVDGEYVKVTKSTMSLADKDYQEFIKKFMTNLKENDKFIEAYAKVSNESKTEIKKQLSDDSNYEDVIDGQKINISIYTEGLFNNFKGIVISSESSYEKYSMDILKIGKDNYEYKIQNGSTSLAKGTLKITEENDSNVITLTMNLGIASVKLLATTNIKEDVKVETKKIDNSVELDNLTPEETTEITNKIMSSTGMTAIINEINNIMNSYSSLGY